MEPKQAIEQVSDKRFALLIDADNVSAKYIKPIMAELSKYGTITYKRIYGDWTLSLHAKWKDALLENSITPIQQFSYTYGKNSTDSAMIIDAMDILYTGQVEGFCIVSSDSDFTRLASRLRESGRTVIGMGEKKTPAPFRKACDIFTVLELLVKAERSEKAGGPVMSKPEVEQAVVDIVVDNQNNGKATGLGEIGSRLQKRYPDFDVRNYGTNLLSKLLGEFTRVKITKDHSSVAVELVDNGETEKPAEKPVEPNEAKEAKSSKDPKEAEAEPKTPKEDAPNDEAKSRGEGKNGKSKQDEPKAESAEAAKEEPKHVEDEPEKDNRPGRRNRRSRRLRLSVTESREAAKPESQAEGGAPSEAKDVDAADRPNKTAGSAEDQPAESASEPVKTVKPARKPRRKRKIAPAEETSVAEAVDNAIIEADVNANASSESESTAATASKPKPKSKSKPKPKSKSKSESEPEPHSPQLLIRKLITQAGEDGIALTKLGEDIRAEFKNFKVRDLGFAQLRLYIANVEDFEVVKHDKAFFAKLRK